MGELAYFSAAGVAIYALPPYVTGPVGSDTAGAGLAFGAFAVTALILRPVAGRLSDRVGRRPLLVGGALLAAAMMLLTALADTLPLVVALRLGVGVAEAAFFVAAFAALADLAPSDRMGEALSYNSLGLYLGLPSAHRWARSSCGRSVSRPPGQGPRPSSWSPRRSSHSIGETRPPRTPEDDGRRLSIHWTTVPPALGFLTSVVAMGGFLAFASLHAQRWASPAPACPLAVYGVVVVVCRIVFAKVPDRLPPLRLGATALVAIAAGMTTAAVWATPTGFLLVCSRHGARGLVQHSGVLHRHLRGGQAV